MSKEEGSREDMKVIGRERRLEHIYRLKGRNRQRGKEVLWNN